MKLIATRGLPASGKTTIARAWVAQDPVNRQRVNRDDLRGMLTDSVYIRQADGNPGTEKAAIAARDATVSALLKRGLSVIVDDTNLPSRTIRDLRRLAVLAGADFEVIDLTDVPVETCVKRDAARSPRVGAEVIEQHWLRFIKGRPHPLPIADEPDDPSDAKPYEPDLSKPEAVMVDIDGTVALMGTRSPYDETLVHLDRPNGAVIANVRALWRDGHRIVFCSGRTDACRDATEEWLAEHVGVTYDALLMRATGDMRKDAIVKQEIFDRHIREHYNVVLVLDDRNQVVQMWRAMGLTVLQVAEGDF